MEEGVFLVDVAVFGVENLGVPGVNDVLDYVGELVHFGLSLQLVFAFVFEFFQFLKIFSHHVLLSQLIESVTHFLASICISMEKFT